MLQRFEIIFIHLYDVGRSSDITAIASKLGISDVAKIDRGKDTPESLLLPKALICRMDDLAMGGSDDPGNPFTRLRTRAKIYEEGVVTMECRVEAELELKDLHTVRSRQIEVDGMRLTLDRLAEVRFRSLMEKISGNIIRDQYDFPEYEHDHYSLFCLLDRVKDPSAYIKENRHYIAPFLLGEDPTMNLHEQQIELTLRHPFSFSVGDIAIFDLDRAFIIGPDRDYEDLVLIVEHANYRLLELRTLDRLLDRWIDEAETDIRQVYTKPAPAGKRARKRKRFRRIPPFMAYGLLSRKIANLQPLRFDALFILENLENSSRIIGDYYLEKIYDHLCSMFNTQGWKSNVERRLDILQNIYGMAKTDLTDRTMLMLEILVALMIAIELFAFFAPAFH
jgi:hypothetical protein